MDGVQWVLRTKSNSRSGGFSLSVGIEHRNTGIPVVLTEPNTLFRIHGKGFICISVASLLLFINQLRHLYKHLF
jgi:hypothetical protein